ncbi:DUF4198 domain-containing protein [Sphingobacterium deserti]|uniref:Nickel transport complex protein, NikM subunit, transmembrane n=1 Tax=Sphingobacterium deserti TaxID=1229276 RepID=A0A0B8T5P2_9SPHI|nr:DUF4198 domain-containing protein [Sphingobacterium deserti]KGE13034.1 hypothetical protein DI53_3251 [Sphingobacterium deserti]
MKSLPYLFLAFIALVLGTQAASAHAIWLESSAKATKGQAQEVRVYYGEYATGELEKTTAWYSDLKSLEVFVVKSDQSEEKLTLQDKGDHFVSTFTPTEDGVYLIYTSHPTKDLGGKTRYEFTSQIAVQAGKSEAVAKSKLPYQLTIGTKAIKKGGKVALQVTNNGQPVKDQDVLLMSEAGWSKTFKTDAQGIANVDVLWSGKYVAEFGHSEEVKGTWHGQEYNATWQGLTTSFLVK